MPITPPPQAPTPCEHEDFAAVVEINRITGDDGGPVIGYSADIKVNCLHCGEPFQWMGLEAGMQPHRPMCSVDGTLLVAPLRPASAPEGFGLGLPGYTVRGYVRDD